MKTWQIHLASGAGVSDTDTTAQANAKFRAYLKPIADEYTATGSLLWDDVLNGVNFWLLPPGFVRPNGRAVPGPLREELITAQASSWAALGDA